MTVDPKPRQPNPAEDHAGHETRDAGGGHDVAAMVDTAGSHDMAGMQGMAGMGHGMQGMHDPGMMMRQPHAMSRWVNPVLMGLGAWLVASPFILGYETAGLIWSDVASGLLLILFAWLSLDTERGWAPWGSVAVGTWLLFAPLVFWAHEPAAYTNDTFVGALAVAFAIVIPMGMEMSGPQVPAGWSYNPSSWTQRVPIIVIGLLGFLLSRYMASYQLGHIAGVWDPFFGDGTVRVLESDVSKMFPVSDAGLGATLYLLEVLMTSMGDARRWRTMPWMVAFFAVLVVPLGVTSIVLVILQPLAVGAWCTPCLVAAFAMLLMVPLMLDEVVAMGQLLLARRRQGDSLWRTFWFGATGPASEEAGANRPVDATTPSAAFWGLSTPWTIVAVALLGGWLMAAPAVLGTDASRLGDSDRLVGALVVTWAMIALAEVARPVRFLNVPLGLWLLAAPWVLGSPSGLATLADVVAGLLLVALSVPRGRVRDAYAGWDRYVG